MWAGTIEFKCTSSKIKLGIYYKVVASGASDIELKLEGPAGKKVQKKSAGFPVGSDLQIF